MNLKKQIILVLLLCNSNQNINACAAILEQEIKVATELEKITQEQIKKEIINDLPNNFNQDLFPLVFDYLKKIDYTKPTAEILEKRVGYKRICGLSNSNIAVADKDEIYIWDIVNKKLLETLKVYSDECITKLDLLVDGRLLICLYNKINLNHTVQIWDFDTKEYTKIFTDEDPINSICILPQNRIVTSSDGGIIKVRSLETGECLKTLDGPEGQEKRLCLRANGNLVAYSNLGKIKIWDTNNFNIIQEKNLTENLFKMIPSKAGNIISLSRETILDRSGHIIHKKFIIKIWSNDFISLWTFDYPYEVDDLCELDTGFFAIIGSGLKIWDFKSTILYDYYDYDLKVNKISEDSIITLFNGTIEDIYKLPNGNLVYTTPYSFGVVEVNKFDIQT